MHTYEWSCANAHCPTFFEQPIPFTYILFIHCTFITHFKNLPVNFTEWTFLGFKNHINDHTSQAVGNSIFMFNCKDHSECKVGGMWLCTRQYMFPLTYRRWLIFTGNARVTCMASICYQFFLSRCALYIKLRHNHFFTHPFLFIIILLSSSHSSHIVW